MGATRAVRFHQEPDYRRSLTANRVGQVSGTLVDDFSDPAVWTASAESIAAETGDKQFPSAATATATANTYTDFTREFHCDLSDGAFLSFAARTNNAYLNRFELALAVGGTGFTGSSQRYSGTPRYATRMIEDKWHRITVPMSLLAPAGTPTPTVADLADVRKIRLRVFAESGGAASLSLADMRIHRTNPSRGVVWQFDDAYSSVYTRAFPALAASGHVGSACVISELAGTGSYATVAQLLEMEDAGWEIVCHSTNDTAIPISNEATALSTMQTAHAWMITNGFSKQGARQFVMPGGTFSASSLRAMTKIFETARTTDGYVESPFITDYGLVAPYGITASVSLATAQGVLDRVDERGGLAYFAFHDIVTSGATGNEWTTADLTALVAYAQSIGLRSYTPSQMWGAQ